MEVKGTAVSATVDYVRATHGPEGLARLLEHLPADSRQLLTDRVLPSVWYPFMAGFVAPTKAVCDLFHGGDPTGAWNVGRFAAESALKGIYKALFLFISPRTVVERGPGILTNYYRPMEARVKQLADTRFAVVMTGMTERSVYFDHRVAGYVERAVEMTNAKELSVQVVASSGQGADRTEIHFVWKA